jgi:sigma-54 dependent transcriptional regulator
LPLAGHFLELYRSRLGVGPVELAPAASERLLGHGWPGNIRELENVIHSALLVRQGAEIAARDLHLGPSNRPGLPGPDPVPPRAEVGFEALERALVALYDRNLGDLHAGIEAAVMRSAFNYCHRNQVQTARLLGISRNIVRARLLELGEIAPPGVRIPGLLPPAA